MTTCKKVAAVAAFAAAGLASAADFHHNLSGAKPWTSEAFLDDPQEFHFAIIGDLTGGERPNVYARAVEKLNLLRPEFVMSVGDLVAGGGVDRAALQKQWKSFRDRTAKLEMPFFYVVGNHDIWTGFTGMTPGRQTSIDLWKEQFGTNTYYNFTYKGCHFICLDSMERHDYYPPREPLPETQLSWATREIRARPGARWTFIFLHKPLDFTSDRWMRFERGISNVNYTVFCGDWHNYCTARRLGKKYYLLGTTGGGFDGGTVGENLRMGIMDGITWVTVTRDKGPVVAHIAISGVHDGDTIQSCATTRGWIEAPVDYPSHRAEPSALYAGETNTAVVPAEVMEGPGYDWHFRHAVILRQGRIYAVGMEKFKTGKKRVVLLGDESASALAADYPDAQVFDLGFPGDRTQNVIWRLVEGELTGYDPDVVVISVGAHNKASNTPGQVEAARRRIAALVRAHAPRAEVRMQKD
ncbi:MAG: metallophosphoesterase [Kiritimatiellae bacterium]|nr:metallophosphoesterase [Kiritimatiellia bacterium]